KRLDLIRRASATRRNRPAEELPLSSGPSRQELDSFFSFSRLARLWESRTTIAPPRSPPLRESARGRPTSSGHSATTRLHNSPKRTSPRNLPVGRGEKRKLPWSKGPISIGSSCATSRRTAHFSSKRTSGE